MRIVMRLRISGEYFTPNGAFAWPDAGEECDIADDLAKEMIQQGYALKAGPQVDRALIERPHLEKAIVRPAPRKRGKG